MFIYKTELEKIQIGFLKGIQSWQKALYTFSLLLGLCYPIFALSLELMTHMNSPNAMENLRVFLVKGRILLLLSKKKRESVGL